MTRLRLDVSIDKVAEYCRKWRVIELAIFGSALRDDFRTDSDVDVLVSLSEDANWSLADWVDMTDELSAILGREVDLVEKEALRNPFRRQAILTGREVLYAA